MAKRSLLDTFPLVLIAGVIISVITTPLIYKSFDLWKDKDKQCHIYNKLLKLNVTVQGSCPYEKATDSVFYVMLMGAIVLGLAILILDILWVHQLCLSIPYRILIVILIVVFAGVTAAQIIFLMDVSNFQEKDEVMNWKTLYTDMKASLTGNFLRDDTTSMNEISNQLNILFIEYKCCGVDRIHGTTNDFDTSPWCTTNGSCQLTNSQIPKSCCLGVTEENLQSANENCHAKVTPQTYNDKGCFEVLKGVIIEGRIQYVLKLKHVIADGINVISIMVVCIVLQTFGIVGSIFDVTAHSNGQELSQGGECKKESTYENGENFTDVIFNAKDQELSKRGECENGNTPTNEDYDNQQNENGNIEKYKF